VDEKMPVVTVMPSNSVYQKMFSNVTEVKARDGIIISFHTKGNKGAEDIADAFFEIQELHPWLEPIIYTIPLQLLSYHIAVNKGTDVDQPRNLAKSVTVE